jgi:hypothetical protein
MSALLWVWIVSLVITILFIAIPIAFINDKTDEEQARIYGIMYILSGLSTITFIGAFIAWLVERKRVM